MKFVLPAPHQAFDLTMREGAGIRVRQHGNPAGPRIALCHGNGLASDPCYPFWRLLEARYELIVFDVRNTGRNPPHGADGHSWANFAGDQREIYAGIAATLGAEPAVAAFHSLSAIAALSLAVDGEAPWSALVLFDPPICRAEDHQLHQAHPDEDAGDRALACPRELEAKVFATNLDASIRPRVGDIEVPIKLVGAGPGLEGATQPAASCRALAHDFALPYECIAGTGHFLQIEQPERCTRSLEDFLARHELAA